MKNIDKYRKARDIFNDNYRGEYRIEFMPTYDECFLTIYFYNLYSEKYWKMEADLKNKISFNRIYNFFEALINYLGE